MIIFRNVEFCLSVNFIQKNVEFERLFIFSKFRKLLDSKLELATKLGDAEAKIKQLTEGSRKSYWLESLN